MKNNKNKINKKNTKLIKLALALFLLIIFIILILTIKNKGQINKLATDENQMVIGNEPIDISGITSKTEANPPTLGARNDSYKMEWNKLGNNYCRRSRMV